MAGKRDLSGTAVAAVIFAAMIAGILYRYWPGEERDIRRHLSNMAEALSISSTDNEVQHITRYAALREYFAPDVRVHVDTQELVSRDAVIGLLSRMKPPPGGVVVEFSDIKVALVESEDAARVELTAKVSSTDPTTRESTLDQRAVDLTLRKLDGDWVIATAEIRM